MPFSAVDLAATLALASGLLLTSACSRSDAAPAPAPRYVLAASGRLDARGEARFLAAERDGRIAQVLVRPGNQVAAGDVLLRLACEDVTAQADAAQASAAAAQADARLIDSGPRAEDVAQGVARAGAATARLGDAQDLLHRAEALQTSGFVSARRLAGLRADVAEAGATAAAADAALAALHHGARRDERVATQARATAAAAAAQALAAQTAKCTLRAPIAGQVLRLFKREGEFSGASTGTTLVVIGDLSRMIVRAEVLDRDAALVRRGQLADVWLDGDSRRWRARVVEAASLMGRRSARSLDPSDRFDRDVREVLLAFDGAPPPALVGLRVNVGLRG